jgi:hypothetical protein
MRARLGSLIVGAVLACGSCGGAACAVDASGSGNGSPLVDGAAADSGIGADSIFPVDETDPTSEASPTEDGGSDDGGGADTAVDTGPPPADTCVGDGGSCTKSGCTNGILGCTDCVLPAGAKAACPLSCSTTYYADCYGGGCPLKASTAGKDCRCCWCGPVPVQRKYDDCGACEGCPVLCAASGVSCPF